MPLVFLLWAIAAGLCWPLLHAENAPPPSPPPPPPMTTGENAAMFADNAPVPFDEAELLAGTDERIRAHRTAPLTVRLLSPLGEPQAGVAVEVRHLRHLFAFGAGLDQPLLKPEPSPEREQHRAAFLQLYNTATVHCYWWGYEREPGQRQEADRRARIAWAREQGLRVRLHPLIWNMSDAPWQKELEPTVVRGLLDAHLDHLAATLVPLVDDVDFANELVRWDRNKTRTSAMLPTATRVAEVAALSQRMRQAVPRATLTINDYYAGPDYVTLLREYLAAGGQLDQVGLQSHMHMGTWKPAHLWQSLELLATLGRPILLSELSVLSAAPRKEFNWARRFDDWETTPEGEAEQADYLELFYRMCFSHPQVSGVVYWNYSDAAAWLGAPVGVLRRDGSPKPAFDRLDALINRAWRTHGTFVTGADGTVTIPAAFEGEYALGLPGQADAGRARHVGGQPLTVTLLAVAPPAP